MEIDFNDYVTVDIETTGLTVGESEILEVTYAHGLNAPVTLYPEFYPGIFKGATPKALEVNQFFDRFAGDDSGEWFEVDRNMKDVDGVVYSEAQRRYEVWLDLPLEATHGEWEHFVNVIKGRTIVGSNPSFDMKFLEDYLSDFTLAHSHRLFDIAAYAAGKYGKPKPIGLWDTIDIINVGLFEGEIPKGDHTSERDVLSTRQVLCALLDQDSVLRTLMHQENKKKR